MADGTLDLLHYGFYEDDNSDPDACTQVGSEDTALSRGTGTANRFMVRFLLNETGAKSGTVSFRLERELNNSGTWVDVTASSAVAQITGGTPADQAVCNANLLTPPGGKSFPGDWFDGHYDDGDGIAASNIVAKSDYTEVQYCVFLVDADVSDTDTVKFRHLAITGTWGETWSVEAEVTVSAGAPVDLRPKQVVISRAPMRASIF